jgi:hypothetical protein
LDVYAALESKAQRIQKPGTQIHVMSVPLLFCSPQAALQHLDQRATDVDG